MAVVVEQLLLLFAFLLAGYLLCRLGMADQDLPHGLSVLELNVFVPCLQFQTFATNLTRAVLQEKLEILLWGVGTFAIVYLLSALLARRFAKDPYEDGVYLYNFLVPNFGFLGYALIEALYGSDMLLNMVIFGLPLTVYCYTEGYRRLCCQEKFSWRKLCNPSVVAMVLGAVVGLSGIPVPSFLTGIVLTGKACMAPVSMLLTGIVVAQFQPKAVLGDKRHYIAALLRLLVLPAVVALSLKLLRAPWEVYCVAVILNAMPSGLSPIIFPQLVHRDCHLGAGMALVSNVAVLASLPLIMALFL